LTVGLVEEENRVKVDPRGSVGFASTLWCTLAAQ
jgi:hypothetical protein